MHRHAALAAILLSVTVHGGTPPAVSFQREVRSILSDNCFHCHGPDKGTRMAGLRLDVKEGAFSTRKGGKVIVPGNPKASLLYQRISSPDASQRMPPEWSHKALTPQQIAALKAWIEQGANWEDHWAFVAPVRPQPPSTTASGWLRGLVDAFVLAKLEAAGLSPAPEADRRSLIRRLSLDLTGLPPSPEEITAFLNDTSPDAYENLVDRLMAKPQWGEHRGRYWLDAARYGDTHGIHIDNYRDIWPYRDWVIHAFNANMPFDRFTVEQLAGDLLPNHTLEQEIATGFHRCNVTTNEGGAIVEEVAAIYAKDRADTTGAVWLGLTVGCATCHDHKFDPISQRDFYAMTAFFRNTTQHPMDGNISDTPPIAVVPNPQDRARWDALSGVERSTKLEMAAERDAAEARIAAWLASPARASISVPLSGGPGLFSLSFDGALRYTNSEGTFAPNLSEGLALGGSPLPGRNALYISSQSALELPGVPQIDTGRPFSVSAWIYFPKGEGGFSIVRQTDPKDKKRGWAFYTGGRVPSVRLTGDGGESVEVSAGHLDQMIPGTWNHVAFSYDGSGEAPGVRIFINGKETVTQRDSRAQVKGSIHNAAPLRLGDPERKYDEPGAIAELRILPRPIGQEEAHLLALWPAIEMSRPIAAAQLDQTTNEGLRRYYLLNEDAQYARLAERLAGIAAERRDIRRRGAVTLVMQERTDQKPFAHVLYRGQYDQPRDRLEAATPKILPPMTEAMPRNRLGLAMWLVDPGNPLMARVTVNRFWQEIFGTGLVKTSEDFGSQGQPPSHPELLDWLAVEFRESGWDVKKFFRMLVTSATYRQAAVLTPGKLEKDPDNRLLSRGPRYRMDGEMVRDSALAASGLLVPVIGGPSVKPYQPDGVWEAVAMEQSDTRFYKRDTGDKLYRRSMYTLWKRSAPPASMDIFNAPSRESCTVRRERTNTPLQALVTMNDPQFVEAARVLAQQAWSAGKGNLDSTVDFMSVRLVARPLSSQEKAIVFDSYRSFLGYYDAKPEDARKLISTGERPVDTAVPPVELAALTMLANQLMNLDEVLTK
jgi:hypothetical protein